MHIIKIYTIGIHQNEQHVVMLEMIVKNLYERNLEHVKLMQILHGMSVHSPATNAVMDQVCKYSLINQTILMYLPSSQNIETNKSKQPRHLINIAKKETKRTSYRVITKLPNSEQSYKWKVKTHKYINRKNQSTTEKL